MKNTTRNIFYQGIFQIVKTVLPLISIPIVSHALGASAIGEYSFYNSIIQYFVLMAAVGIPLYGVREIAKRRDNQKSLSKLFYQLEFLSLSISIIVTIIALVLGILLKYPSIYFIQLFLIIGSGIDISWLFMGVEDFSKVTVVNTLIAIISVLLLYVFVHTPNDIVLYTFIMVFGMIIGQIVPWLFVKKYVSYQAVKTKDIVNHIKETCVLFFPQVSILVYTVINKIILGFFAGNVSVAIYSNSMFIVSSLVVLIGVVDTAFLPRVSYQASNNDYKSAAKTLGEILQIQAFINIGIIFGVISISKQFIPWFFGASFLGMEKVLPILIIAILFITAGTSLSRQFFVPMNRLKPYNIIVMVGAVVSLALNFITIPIWGVIGAALTTLLIEILLWSIELVYFYRFTGISYDVVIICKNIISGLIMSFLICFITNGWNANIITTIVQILIGTIVYFAVNQVFHSNTLFRFFVKK